MAPATQKASQPHEASVPLRPWAKTGKTTTNLCERCSKLDIPSMLSKLRTPEWMYYYEKVLDLGPFPAEFGAQSCTLCKFFYDMRWPRRITPEGLEYITPHRNPCKLTTTEAAELPGRSYQLVATTMYNDNRWNPTLNGWKDYKRTVDSGEFATNPVLAVVDSEWRDLIDWEDDTPPAGEVSATAGFIYPIVEGWNDTKSIMSIRDVPESPLQSSFLSDCLDLCKKHHTRVCGVPAHGQQPRAARWFLDCDTGEKVKAEEGYEYIALSYRWGHQQGFNLKGPRLKVVQDAIQVVKALGKRYLWVDQYCINQDDEVEKAQQIKGMAFIYENAVATIVDAVGPDSGSGLRGLSKPRPRPAQWSSGKVTLYSTLPDPVEVIRQSIWYTRGWTFQEGICASRLIVFAEDQVYFECREMGLSERLDSPLRKADPARYHHLLRVSVFQPEPRLFNWISPRQPEPSFDNIWDCIVQYTGRKISRDKDSLNAFRGILERFRSGPLRCGDFQGIPIDATVDGEDLHQEFVRRLCWAHAGSPARRRPNFPSWTWAGWEGPVEATDDSRTLDISTDVELDVQVELTDDGGKVPWREYWASRAKAIQSGKSDGDVDDKFHCLCLKAPILRLEMRVSYEGKDGAGTATRVYLLTNRFSERLTYEIHLPSDRMMDPEFVASLDGRTRDFVVLRGGKGRDLDSRPFLMMLDWHSDGKGAKRIWGDKAAERIWGDWIRGGPNARFFAEKLEDPEESVEIRLF